MQLVFLFPLCDRTVYKIDTHAHTNKMCFLGSHHDLVFCFFVFYFFSSYSFFLFFFFFFYLSNPCICFFFLLLSLYFLFFIFFILFYFLFGPKAPPALFLQGILPESDCMFSQAFWLSEHLTAGHPPPPVPSKLSLPLSRPLYLSAL